MTWLLCDFGEVLSLPQAEDGVTALAALVGQDLDTFRPAYSRRRLDYDRGDLTATEYWTTVMGRTPGPELVDQLVAVDTTSWIRPNQASLDACRRAADRGLRLAVLSNMPAEIAATVDRLDWLASFEPRLFSFDLRLTKPDPAIYRVAVKRLDADPADVFFFDDRPDNVTAARDVGLQASLFTDPAAFDRLQPRG